MNLLTMAILTEEETPTEMIIKGHDLSMHFILGHLQHWDMSICITSRGTLDEGV